MAQPMNGNREIEFLRPGAIWEKSGNTSWAQCPNCDDWFHVGTSLLDRPDVPMHCPHCHHEFSQDHAKRLVKAE